MKQFHLYLLLLIASIFCSCRNYTKEFKQLTFELETKGTLIDKNEKLHMVLYEEDGCVKANDLDTCWIVFSPQNQLNTYKYQLDIDDKGIHVIAKIEKINIKNDIISYGKNYLSSSKSIITDSNGKLSHFNLTIYPNDNNNIKWYEYDSRKSNLIIPELHSTSLEKEFGEKDTYNNDYWNSISIDASFISDKLNSLYESSEMKFEPLSGTITVYFKTNNGKIDQISDVMKYINEDYNIRYKLEDFKGIDAFVNFYYSLNQEIANIQQQMNFEEIKKAFIDISELDKLYSENAARADLLYKGKRVKISCKIEKMQNNNNLITFLNYKYKLIQKRSVLFGGYNIEAYSNDENFINIDFPKKIYMEATMFLRENESIDYYFTDCKLIMTE